MSRKSRSRRPSRPPRRRGFTLAELLVASVIIAFIWGTVTVSLRQLATSKRVMKTQLDAYLRADAALAGVRRDLVSVLRSADLFWTRVLITDGSLSTPEGYLDRDEILVFNNRMRPVRRIDYIGEGIEYETQYRIEEDDLGPVLWQRRDPVPDEYLLGGGIATPLVEGVVSFNVQAYDGEQWFDNWDSDYDGLPWALRVRVAATGHRPGKDPLDAPMAVLRTVIPIDRVPVPADLEGEGLGLAAGGAEGAGGEGEAGDGSGGSGGTSGGGRGGGDQPPGTPGFGREVPAPGGGGDRRRPNTGGSRNFTGSSRQ